MVNIQFYFAFDSGITTCSLGLTNQTSFTFKLGYGDAMLDKISGEDLVNYAVQETKDNQVVYYLRLPQRGDYFLIIFANLVPDDPETAEGTYKAICEYKIVCDEPAKAKPATFPACSDVSWGPDAYVLQHGLTPNSREAILLAPDGSGQVTFQKQGDVRVFARLVKPGVKDEDLKDALSVKTEDNKVDQIPLSFVFVDVDFKVSRFFCILSTCVEKVYVCLLLTLLN